MKMTLKLFVASAAAALSIVACQKTDIVPGSTITSLKFTSKKPILEDESKTAWTGTTINWSKERIRQIEERNRQRRIQREMEAQDCDEPIADVYGPMPPMPWENHTIPKEEEKDEDKKEEKEEDTGVIRGFFARFFGKKHS